jgi:beta-lactamase regulating signal transducer with metallopeptidase domain
MTLLLLNTTIKISFIVTAALAATTLLRGRSAAMRHFVLAVALACAAATPLVRVVAPAWQSASRLQLIDRPLAVFDDSTAPAASGVVRVQPGRAISAAAVMRAVGIIWMTGVALAVAVLLVGLVRLSWIASHARRIVDGPWAEAANEIAQGYRLRAVPLVLQSDQRSVLGTWGVARAKVLLPADALDWPADRIRIVLAHELAHVRRGDWIVQMAVELLCAAYWFNPLVWLASRRLRLESEQACDDAVLRLGVEGPAYASELVDLARAFKADRQRFVPAAAIARPSSLERRVRAMLNVKLNRDPVTRTASIAAALVLAAVTVLVAGFGVSAQGQFATVSGTVVDQNSKPINGVRLVLSNATAQTKNEVKTDTSGHYEFVGVQAGSYELMFESIGMAYLKREGLNLAGGQTAQVNAVMKIGSVEETISVTNTPDDRPRVSGYPDARANQKPDPCAASAQGGCIRPPTKIRDVRPVFPPGADGGTVELVATIDTDGRISFLDVVGNGRGGPTTPVLADAAAEAVRQWEFTPTHLDGQPIETNMKVHVTFSK